MKCSVPPQTGSAVLLERKVKQQKPQTAPTPERPAPLAAWSASWREEEQSTAQRFRSAPEGKNALVWSLDTCLGRMNPCSEGGVSLSSEKLGAAGQLLLV